MLAAAYLFQRGTPFLYQGQEIGMTNIHLPSIDSYEDVASKNAYYAFFTFEKEKKRMARIYAASRDSARTPMQWDDSPYGGFSRVRPWFFVNRNYPAVNVQTEEEDPESILNFYRKCLSLRKEQEVFLWGSYREFKKQDRFLYIYEREYQGTRALIFCSFSKKERRYAFPKGYDPDQGQLLLGNYPEEDPPRRGILRPYETLIYLFQK